MAEPAPGPQLPTVYPYLLNPKLYPDYPRRPTPAPTWETFDHQPQFTALRHLPDASFVSQGLGRVCWPHLDTVWSGKNGAIDPQRVADSVAELKRRNWYLFDIGGYVPGTLEAQARVPPETTRMLQDKLGEKYLGMDMGENDGRYLFLMRQVQAPYAADRIGQCEEAYRYFSQINSDLGERLNALDVYWYWSYPLKEGSVVLAGAEAQNRVTSSTIQYSFLRGAGKQYGVPWFGNASVFRTWDYKSYNKSNDPRFGAAGPTKGNSLALLRRLLFSHYLYNSVILGYEGAMYMNDWWSRTGTDTLSPLGLIQQDAVKFVDAHPQPGVMHTPVALLLDYYAGWTPARTLTSTYQVWGYLPYDAGDFFTHSVLEMLYPHYEDCSYYHDERGTFCDTPYGDIADVLHSDARAEILQQYGVVVATGNLFTADAELRDKLTRYVAGGGRLVITADNARRLWPEWQIGQSTRIPAGAQIQWANGAPSTESLSMDLCPAVLPAGAEILARCGERTAVARVRQGSGQIILLLSPFGLNAEPTATGKYHSGEPDQPLKQPYQLLSHVQRVLDSALRSQELFSVGDNLGYITCRKGPGDYTIGVFNNSLHALPFAIKSFCGPVRKITELPLGRDQTKAAGYWPLEFQQNDGGKSTPTTIAGGDVRLFSVQVAEAPLRVLPELAPATQPAGRWLALRHLADLGAEIRRRPTFFEHFDGVQIDWTYLWQRDPEQVKRDRVWLDRQKLQVVVDFTSGLNGFPDLTLLDLLPTNYAESVIRIDNVLDKMKLLGVTRAIIGTHMPPELGVTPAQSNDSFAKGLSRLCARAQDRGITLYLTNRPERWRGSVSDILAIISQSKAPNLQFALNTAGTDVPQALTQAGSHLGLVLASAPHPTVPLTQAPLASEANLQALRLVRVPVILEAEYRGPDDLYRDIKALWGQPGAGAPP